MILQSPSDYSPPTQTIWHPRSKPTANAPSSSKSTPIWRTAPWPTCPQLFSPANSAWLVAAVMAYNLTRAAGLLAAGPFGNASVFISPKRVPGKRPGKSSSPASTPHRKRHTTPPTRRTPARPVARSGTPPAARRAIRHAPKPRTVAAPDN